MCAQRAGGPQPLQQLLAAGESGAWLSLVWLMEPILIQDAEDIIDLNKLSVKEKL